MAEVNWPKRVLRSRKRPPRGYDLDMGSERTFTYCSCKSTEAVVGLFSYGSRPRDVRRWTDVYVESLDHRMSFGLVWFIGALYISPIWGYIGDM